MAATRMRTWFLRGTGIGTSSTRRTSGGPYLVHTTAFTPLNPFGTFRVALPATFPASPVTASMFRTGRAAQGHKSP